MKKSEMAIEGMTCEHCVKSVRKELSKIDGVKIIDVQIGKARIEYDESEVAKEILYQAVVDAGYRVVGMQS